MNDDNKDMWVAFAALFALVALIACMVFVPSCSPMYVAPPERW